MDTTQAAARIQSEVDTLTALLAHEDDSESLDVQGASEHGDRSDSATSLTSLEQDAAVVDSLRERLSSLHRAQRRLDAGTYGFSVRSMAAISNERLESDPASELTLDEAEFDERTR
jgi:RNA polymerase-binding transcription factor DksA